MQSPALWARFGLLWCLLMFAASAATSAKAATPDFSSSPAEHAIAVVATPSGAPTTVITVANTQAKTTHNTPTANGAVVHAIPTLDGFGLFVLATLLGLGILWFRRRRQ